MGDLRSGVQRAAGLAGGAATAAGQACCFSVTVAVPIISTNEGGLLRHALLSALAQDDVDVVVFDNDSDDDTATVAAELGVRCIRLEPRHSYCHAMNVALASVAGDAVLLMQPDCLLHPGFLAAARRRLADPTVGSVAPKLIRAEGPDARQRLDQIDTAGMIVDRRRKNGLVGHGRRAAAYGVPGEAFGADGAAAVYRRAALDEAAIEGQIFDEDLVYERGGATADWGSDADLAWRLRLLGWRCVYEPGALAYHVRRYSPTNRPRIAEWQRMVQFRNRYLMIVKNDPLPAMLRDLPVVLAYEVAALGFVLLRERFLLEGYREALAALPRMRDKRRRLQRRRRELRAPAVPYGLTPPR
jgi:GT2 family glycosyltransferase